MRAGWRNRAVPVPRCAIRPATRIGDRPRRGRTPLHQGALAELPVRQGHGADRDVSADGPRRRPGEPESRRERDGRDPQNRRHESQRGDEGGRSFPRSPWPRQRVPAGIGQSTNFLGDLLPKKDLQQVVQLGPGRFRVVGKFFLGVLRSLPARVVRWGRVEHVCHGPLSCHPEVRPTGVVPETVACRRRSPWIPAPRQSVATTSPARSGAREPPGR